MIHDVRIRSDVWKQLERVPKHVAEKLTVWIEAVESDGLEEVRKKPGFHDDRYVVAGKASAQFASVARIGPSIAC